MIILHIKVCLQVRRRTNAYVEKSSIKPFGGSRKSLMQSDKLPSVKTSDGALCSFGEEI